MSPLVTVPSFILSDNFDAIGETTDSLTKSYRLPTCWPSVGVTLSRTVGTPKLGSSLGKPRLICSLILNTI